MNSLRQSMMPTAFVCPVRTRYDAKTDRPADLEAYLCPTVFTLTL